MSGNSRLLADTYITADHIISAQDQAGPYMGQPVPALTNTGDLKPRSKSSKNFTYSGTCTSNGNAGGTTLIDSLLAIYGNDYLIGASVAITSGACSGETGTISDFVQSTGTITLSGAFTAQILSGVTFTVTMDVLSMDFHVQLLASGDPSVASFKWSHDGGTTWLGRDDPKQATWGNAKTVATVFGLPMNPIVQAGNGNLLFFYEAPTTGYPTCKISTDNGITFGSAITIHSVLAAALSAVRLASGRIIVLTSNPVYYSDDNGETWAYLADGANARDVILLDNGNLLAVCNLDEGYGWQIAARISSDGGATWSDNIKVTANSVVNSQLNPSVAALRDGTIICMYSSNQLNVSRYSIFYSRSTDGGATWSAGVTPTNLTWVDENLGAPYVITDIDNTLIVVYAKGKTKAMLSYSTDKGWNWSVPVQASAITTGTYDKEPWLCLFNGHEIMLSFLEGNSTFKTVRRGEWTTYSANACPCAINLTEQVLVDDTSISWGGMSGVMGDIWTFLTEYYGGAKNIVSGSPSIPWRSTSDNVACSIILDFGAQGRNYIDGVAFFGCNLRTLTFEQNSANSWASPALTLSVSFDTTVGTIDAVSGANIMDTSLLAGYYDHQLKGMYVRATSGTDSGVTWKILDNVGSWIMLDTLSATNLAAGNTFVIFQPDIAVLAAGLAGTEMYRYARISIPAQKTPEGYYQVGEFVAGKVVTLARAWGYGYKKTNQYNIDIQRSPAGTMTANKRGKEKRIFGIGWNAADDVRNQVISLLNALDGRNVVLIPTVSNLKDCYLTKHTGNVEQSHKYLNQFDFSATLEEQV